ncbi:MAG: hypothetical protein E6Q06_03225 [Candidatus Moraniibacteriota bacterium]|nr:MAG: hypothetical protein E6Q06_03225 [Candidatus Moranbacteria bacterium]
MELLTKVSILGFALVWSCAFLVMLCYRRKEERLYQDWNVEKDKVRGQTIAMPVIEGQIRVLDAKYEPLIQEIERKKKFIKDILPFMSSK